MVDLEPVVDTEDVEAIKDLLARHIRHTQSPVAARLLVDWEHAQERFVKVIPKDYKRVLAAIKKARETGIAEDDAIRQPQTEFTQRPKRNTNDHGYLFSKQTTDGIGRYCSLRGFE